MSSQTGTESCIADIVRFACCMAGEYTRSADSHVACQTSPPCPEVQPRTFVPAVDSRAAFCEPAVALEASAADNLGAWNSSFL